MDLFEYQARDLFEANGVPVLAGAVASTPEEARAAAASMGGKVVVKAQVKIGGRGKAGGVKLAESPDDAFTKAEAILGMDIKGHLVRKVMIAQAAPIESEYYLAILLDRAARTFLVMASVAGGMDIEEVAHKTPEKLARVHIDPIEGISTSLALDIVRKGGFPSDVENGVAEVLVKLWETFQKSDATLVEVNPLVKTADGRIIALDGKVTLDDNASFRHPDHESLIDHAATNPINESTKVIVQGMTGSEGTKHTRRMIASGTNIVGGVTPGKGGQVVDIDGRSLPVFNSVSEAVSATGANASVIFVPPKFAKAAVIDAVDAKMPLVVVITEGIPVHDTAQFYLLSVMWQVLPLQKERQWVTLVQSCRVHRERPQQRK
ncbi:MAG: succinate--CoA ligase subunit beta [Actinobacteria bacterium]|nr:succinate--CoA ligase subunit beta [Actinomycetota bacterium]